MLSHRLPDLSKLHSVNVFVSSFWMINFPVQLSHYRLSDNWIGNFIDERLGWRSAPTMAIGKGHLTFTQSRWSLSCPIFGGKFCFDASIQKSVCVTSINLRPRSIFSSLALDLIKYSLDVIYWFMADTKSRSAANSYATTTIFRNFCFEIDSNGS